MSIYVRACKKDILEKFGKTFNTLTNKVLQKIFNRYKVKQLDVLNEDKLVVIKRSVINDDKTWNYIYRQFKGNSKGFIPNQNNEEQLVCNPTISEIIKNHMDNFVFENSVYANMRIREIEDDENSKLQNIYSLKEFNDQHPESKIDKKEIEYNYYIPNEVTSFDNLHTLFNREHQSFEFLLNPRIPISRKLVSDLSVVRKYEIEIVDDPIESVDEKFISKYKYRCPRCYQIQELLPVEIHSTIKHDCGFGDNGITVKESALEPFNAKQMYVYEANIIGENNERLKTFLHSFRDDLKRTRYLVNICTGFNYVKNKKEATPIYLILGHETKQVKLNTTLVQSEDAKKWCIKNDMPYVKFLDALFSARNVYQQYTGMTINDQGMILQIFGTLSSLMKIIFNHNKYAISVIGTTSLGKTYIGYFLGILFDQNFKFISNTRNISLVGLVGGVDMKKSVNGRELSWFEKGILSRSGITLFDEGKQFFINPDLNDTLKDFPSRYISIEKIKKATVENIFTPWIFSNLNEHHEQYKNEVIKNYLKFVQYAKDFKHHKLDKASCMSYIMGVNLFLPLEYYKNSLKNEILTDTIAFVRKSYASKDKDWKTGGSIPAANRILFDIISYHPENLIEEFEDISMNAESFKTVLPDDVPVEDFIKTIKARYKAENNIDLLDMHNNTEQIREQLQKLKASVHGWFRSRYKMGGRKVHQHLSENKRKMDPKLESLSVALVMGMQLLEDINSTELSPEIKKWAKLILCKCKRGLTKTEYDFTNHRYEPELIDIEFEKLKYNLQQIEEEHKMEKFVEAERKAYEQEQQKEKDKSNIGLNLKSQLTKAGYTIYSEQQKENTKTDNMFDNAKEL